MERLDKKNIRKTFRRAVFGRDEYRCILCGARGYDHNDSDTKPVELVPLDAHHVTNRNDMPYGGYVVENGISVCQTCHLLVEDPKELKYGAENLYNLIGSSYELAYAASDKLGAE